MSSPVPLLRPPQPGGRGKGVGGLKLGLAIPPSPNQRPVGPEAEQPGDIPRFSLASKGGAPKLSLATPMGTQGPAIEQQGGRPSKPKLTMSTSQESTARSRSDSHTNDPSMPPSASSSTYSSLSFISQSRQTPDPSSAISVGGASMERENSMGGLSIDFEALSLQKGHPIDVEDLDDEAWMAASEQKKIIEKGPLGEGAGGAVTRCMLEGGKTVFALKIITTSPDPDVKKQILRELKFNKNCTSDYICRYYGAFMDKSSSTISIAMEFCEGGSLDSIYREVKKLGGRTGEKVLGRIAEGVLHGLTYLNSRKIIHRGKSTGVHPYRRNSANYFQTSSHPTFYSAEMVKSSSVILVSQANSAQKATPILS